jgi:hypothetical protein
MPGRDEDLPIAAPSASPRVVELSYQTVDVEVRWWRWLQLTFPAGVAAIGIGGRVAAKDGRDLRDLSGLFEVMA